MRRLLMVEPTYFDITYAINPHMVGDGGALKKVDQKAAARQWQDLKSAYESVGCRVDVMPGGKALPDMVFSANHGLPIDRQIVLSCMSHPERRAEIPLFRRYYESRGYTIHDGESLFGPDLPFEGMGDALWSRDRSVLFGGYGFRTSENAYRILKDQFAIHIVPLRLVDAEFYHLDTAMFVLDPSTVAIVESALAPESLQSLRDRVERVISIPESEARSNFAANAYCPDGKHVVLQRGSAATCSILKKAGFKPVEVDTSEFIKAGGSAFCMKMELE